MATTWHQITVTYQSVLRFTGYLKVVGTGTNAITNFYDKDLPLTAGYYTDVLAPKNSSTGYNGADNTFPISGFGFNFTSTALQTVFGAPDNVFDIYGPAPTLTLYKTPNSGTWGSATLAITTLSGQPMPDLPASICFLAGTPVKTDQGDIAIDKIDVNSHTIRHKKIVAITKTVTVEDKIVCIEKDALGPNVPSQKTHISRNHTLFYKNQMISAKDLIGKVDGVYNKKYNGEYLYNVLLDNHDKMMVNNMIVETLDPEHFVAKLHNGYYTEEQKNTIIINRNIGASDYKKLFGKIK